MLRSRQIMQSLIQMCSQRRFLIPSSHCSLQVHDAGSSTPQQLTQHSEEHGAKAETQGTHKVGIPARANGIYSAVQYLIQSAIRACIHVIFLAAKQPFTIKAMLRQVGDSVMHSISVMRPAYCFNSLGDEKSWTKRIEWQGLIITLFGIKHHLCSCMHKFCNMEAH